MPTLVIQMGHTGRPPKPGSVGTSGEQDFTRRAGEACRRLLHGRRGWSVRLVEADPPALDYRGDAFVAIHCDGSSNTGRDGASFGYRGRPGKDLAAAIKAAYLVRTGRPATWCEPDNYTANLAQYYGTGSAIVQGNPRAVIFEAGFLTNELDRALLTATVGADRVALAIGDVLGITDPPPPAPTGGPFMALSDDEQHWLLTHARRADYHLTGDTRHANNWPDKGDMGTPLVARVKTAEAGLEDVQADQAEMRQQLLVLTDHVVALTKAIAALPTAVRDAVAQGVVDVDVTVQNRTTPA